MVSLIKGLALEKTFTVRAASKLPFPLDGILRLVDAKGKTLGVLLGKNALEDLSEDWEASRPEFLELLGSSRKTGRVSGREVRRKVLGK